MYSGAPWGFGIKSASGIRLELAFVPSIAGREVEGAAQHRHGANLIGVPMRRVFPTCGEFYAGHEQNRLCRIAIQDDGLRRARERTFELDILRKLQDPCAGVLRHRWRFCEHKEREPEIRERTRVHSVLPC